MSCMQLYDFIRGTKVSLPALQQKGGDTEAPFNIFAPGQHAVDLVDSQVRRLTRTRDSHRKMPAKKAMPVYC